MIRRTYQLENVSNNHDIISRSHSVASVFELVVTKQDILGY